LLKNTISRKFKSKRVDERVNHFGVFLAHLGHTFARGQGDLGYCRSIDDNRKVETGVTQLLAQKTFSGTSHSGTFSKIGSGKRGSRRRIRVVVQAMGKKVSSATTSKTVYVTPVKWEPLTAFMKVTTLRI
jgi:hypothetical protein